MNGRTPFSASVVPCLRSACTSRSIRMVGRGEGGESESKPGAVSGSLPNTGPDSSLRNAFRESWKKRFSGLGKTFVRPEPEEVSSREGGLPILRDILKDFAETDEEMREIRARRIMLEHSLEAAISDERYKDAAQIRDELAVLSRKDPVKTLEELQKKSEEAAKKGDLSSSFNWKACAMEVKKFIPQHILAGVWRGNYGRNGWETVELHYEGTKLIATKLTGDDNVPAGEITFTADISSDGVLGVVGSEPEHPAEKIRGVLETHLDGIVCFKGQGQVAAPGFKQAQMVPGQLILFQDGMLGFLWLPLGSMIMFEHLGDDLEDVDRKEKDKKAAKEKEVEMKTSGLNENVDMAILPGEDQRQTDSTNILIEGEDSNCASPPTTVHDGDASE